MTSNTVPVYRHGRKFYVSTEEYERLRSAEQRQRHTSALKTHHSPVKKSSQTPIRSPSASFYNPIRRTQSNPYEYNYGVLKTPHIPVNSLINTTTTTRRATTRLSRPTLKQYNGQEDLSSNTSTDFEKPTPTIRSKSTDKIHRIRKNSSSSETESDIKRSFSAEISQLSFTSSQQKPTSSRRPVPTTISDYGISPITSFSMTPNEQSQTQTSPSKLTNYFARIKQSSLNPPSALSGTGTTFESGIQGSDHIYSVLGSSNRRPKKISSIITRSKSDNSKTPYHQPETTSTTSFSDDNSSSLLNLIQRRNTDLIHSHKPEYINQLDDEYNQSRSVWTASTNRSQSSDGLLEKKRVRFADMEGLTLESQPTTTCLKSPINTRLLTRRQQVKVSNESRTQPRPFHSALYRTTRKINETKLATDV